MEERFHQDDMRWDARFHQEDVRWEQVNENFDQSKQVGSTDGFGEQGHGADAQGPAAPGQAD